MSVKLRLARAGSKKRPFYRIVAADIRAPRDGRFIEKLGTYNPMLNDEDEARVVVKEERVQHWLSTGAIPTNRVARLLAKKGLFDAPAITDQTKKDKPKAKAQARLAEAEEKARLAAEAAAAEAESAE
jgi:small subunit ribosomal protein S16